MAISAARIMPDGRQKLVRCIRMLLLLDAFLFGLTLSTGMFYSTENNDFFSFFPFPEQCLPLKYLAHHPDDPLFGVKRSTDNTSWCAVEKANIPDLVNQFVEKWLKEYLVKITHHRRVHWDERTALHSDNMQYKHGYVTIPQTGLYQVYSQIVADFDEKPDPYSDTLKLFIHKIAVKKHHGNNGESSVIASTQSQCETKEDGYIKSHIGTVYRFSEGDKVVVKASYPDRIRPNPRMNFFGIHMI